MKLKVLSIFVLAAVLLSGCGSDDSVGDTMDESDSASIETTFEAPLTLDEAMDINRVNELKGRKAVELPFGLMWNNLAETEIDKAFADGTKLPGDAYTLRYEIPDEQGTARVEFYFNGGQRDLLDKMVYKVSYSSDRNVYSIFREIGEPYTTDYGLPHHYEAFGNTVGAVATWTVDGASVEVAVNKYEGDNIEVTKTYTPVNILSHDEYAVAQSRYVNSTVNINNFKGCVFEDMDNYTGLNIADLMSLKSITAYSMQESASTYEKFMDTDYWVDVKFNMHAVYDTVQSFDFGFRPYDKTTMTYTGLTDEDADKISAYFDEKFGKSEVIDEEVEDLDNCTDHRLRQWSNDRYTVTLFETVYMGNIQSLNYRVYPVIEQP